MNWNSSYLNFSMFSMFNVFQMSPILSIFSGTPCFCDGKKTILTACQQNNQVTKCTESKVFFGAVSGTLTLTRCRWAVQDLPGAALFLFSNKATPLQGPLCDSCMCSAGGEGLP